MTRLTDDQLALARSDADSDGILGKPTILRAWVKTLAAEVDALRAERDRLAEAWDRMAAANNVEVRRALSVAGEETP